MKNSRYTFPLLVSLILACILFFLSIIHFRNGLIELINLVNLFNVGILVIVLVITPDIIKSALNLDNKWYFSSQSITFLFLILLTMTGFFIESQIILFMVRVILIALAIASILYVISSGKFEKNVQFIPAFTFLIIFLIVFVYSEGYISILFFEQVVLGLGHRDTLYHLSLSEILTTTKLPSSGIHGAAVINYHWGSNLLYSSLANTLGLNSVQFYNFASPLIFVPLIIKHIVQLINALSSKLVMKELNVYLLCLIVPLLFIVGFFTSSLLGGSTGLATLLVLMYSTIVINYFNEVSSLKPLFLSFTIILFIAILFSKISVIFVYAPAVLVAFIKVERSKLVVLKALLVIGVIAFLGYNFVYPFEMSDSGLQRSLSLKPLFYYFLTRLEVLFVGALSPITNFLPLIIAIVHYSSISSMSIVNSFWARFKENSSILVEVLLIMNILAILPGIFLDLKSVDIYYFRYLHVFLSICLLLVYLNSIIDKIALKNSMLLLLTSILLIFPIFTISGSYDLYFGSRGIKDLKEQFADKTDEQKIVEILLIELGQNKEAYCEEGTAVYIPSDQTWYHSSQVFRTIASKFVVQAFSGCVMIGGLTENDLMDNRDTYSFVYFKNATDLPVKTIEEAKIAALNRGFDKLIVFERKGSELTKELVLVR